MTETRKKFRSPLARIAFASLRTPRKKMNSENEEFSAILLVPKNATGKDAELLLDMRRGAVRALKEKFGEDKKNWPANLRNQDLRTYIAPDGKQGWPFRDGDNQDYDGFAGMVSIRVASDRQPALFDPQTNPLLDPDKPYSGCYVHASLSCYAWSHKESKNKGVSFGLLGVQFVKDGEPFVSRASADDFSKYNDEADSAAAYADDDIPF